MKKRFISISTNVLKDIMNNDYDIKKYNVLGDSKNHEIIFTKENVKYNLTLIFNENSIFLCLDIENDKKEFSLDCMIIQRYLKNDDEIAKGIMKTVNKHIEDF
mgnify:CR=1 FL=1